MAANLTLQQAMGYVYLTGLITGIKTGIPDVVPPAFWNLKKNTRGDQGRYTRVVGTRQTSKRVEYGSPSLKRSLQNVAFVDVKLLHTKENIQMDPLLLQMLRQYTTYDPQSMGGQEVTRQQGLFRDLFDNFRLAVLYCILANGVAYFDINGNLLPSSSGAFVSVSVNINANNQGHCNGIVTSSWAQFNTDIPGQLRALRLRARQLTGYPLKYAFYGQSIPSYMTQNNYVIDYLSRSPMKDTWLNSAELPDGLFGFTWIPVYEAFFADQNGVNQTIFGTEEIVFTPEISRNWYELLEGTYVVPKTLNVSTDIMAALGNVEQVQGMFSYAKANFDPVTVDMIMGDTFLPVVTVPDAIFQMQTNPMIGLFISSVTSALAMGAAVAGAAATAMAWFV